MFFDDYSKKRENCKMKKLNSLYNIYNKKLKYDSETKLNRTESKNIIKGIKKIDEKNEVVFRHYYKIEKELIDYIAELNVKNLANQGSLQGDLKNIHNSNIKMMDIFQKKRLVMQGEERKELEQRLDNYANKETMRREQKIFEKLEKDTYAMKKLEEAKDEMKVMIPQFRILEKKVEKFNVAHDDLRRYYECIKIENQCLISLLNKLRKKNKKILENNSLIIEDKKNINRSLIIDRNKEKDFNNNDFIKIINNKKSFTSRIKVNKNNIKVKNYSSKTNIYNPSPKRYSSKIKNEKEKEKEKNKIKNLIHNKIVKYRLTQKNKIKKNNSVIISSKKPIDNEFTDQNNDSFNLNKYVIESLQKRIDDLHEKMKEKIVLYSHELDFHNTISGFIKQCSEDLIFKYKKLKTELEYYKFSKEKENEILNDIDNLEDKIYIFSYIYDNCLRNGEMKELKKQYNMVQVKK